MIEHSGSEVSVNVGIGAMQTALAKDRTIVVRFSLSPLVFAPRSIPLKTIGNADD
jgi:hypothetical protein